MSNINKFINEEIKKLDESYVYADDSLQFVANVQNSTFHNFKKFTNDFDVLINESNINVKWNIKFWLNQYGVENFIIEADSVEGYYNLEKYDKISDESKGVDKKDINEVNWSFQNNQADLSAGGSLYVRSLSFDFDTSTCTVNF